MSVVLRFLWLRDGAPTGRGSASAGGLSHLTASRRGWGEAVRPEIRPGSTAKRQRMAERRRTRPSAAATGVPDRFRRASRAFLWNPRTVSFGPSKKMGLDPDRSSRQSGLRFPINSQQPVRDGRGPPVRARPHIRGRMISAPTASEEARTAPFPPGMAKTALFSLLLPFPTKAVVRLRRGPH